MALKRTVSRRGCLSSSSSFSNLLSSVEHSHSTPLGSRSCASSTMRKTPLSAAGGKEKGGGLMPSSPSSMTSSVGVTPVTSPLKRMIPAMPSTASHHAHSTNNVSVKAVGVSSMQEAHNVEEEEEEGDRNTTRCGITASSSSCGVSGSLLQSGTSAADGEGLSSGGASHRTSTPVRGARFPLSFDEEEVEKSVKVATSATSRSVRMPAAMDTTDDARSNRHGEGHAPPKIRLSNSAGVANGTSAISAPSYSTVGSISPPSLLRRHQGNAATTTTTQSNSASLRYFSHATQPLLTHHSDGSNSQRKKTDGEIEEVGKTDDSALAAKEKKEEGVVDGDDDDGDYLDDWEKEEDAAIVVGGRGGAGGGALPHGLAQIIASADAKARIQKEARQKAEAAMALKRSDHVDATRSPPTTTHDDAVARDTQSSSKIDEDHREVPSLLLSHHPREEATVYHHHVDSVAPSLASHHTPQEGRHEELEKEGEGDQLYRSPTAPIPEHEPSLQSLGAGKDNNEPSSTTSSTPPTASAVASPIPSSPPPPLGTDQTWDAAARHHHSAAPSAADTTSTTAAAPNTTSTAHLSPDAYKTIKGYFISPFGSLKKAERINKEMPLLAAMGFALDSMPTSHLSADQIMALRRKGQWKAKGEELDAAGNPILVIKEPRLIIADPEKLRRFAKGFKLLETPIHVEAYARKRYWKSLYKAFDPIKVSDPVTYVEKLMRRYDVMVEEIKKEAFGVNVRSIASVEVEEDDVATSTKKKRITVKNPQNLLRLAMDNKLYGAKVFNKRVGLGEKDEGLPQDFDENEVADSANTAIEAVAAGGHAIGREGGGRQASHGNSASKKKITSADDEALARLFGLEGDAKPTRVGEEEAADVSPQLREARALAAAKEARRTALREWRLRDKKAQEEDGLTTYYRRVKSLIDKIQDNKEIPTEIVLPSPFSPSTITLDAVMPSKRKEERGKEDSFPSSSSSAQAHPVTHSEFVTNPPISTVDDESDLPSYTASASASASAASEASPVGQQVTLNKDQLGAIEIAAKGYNLFIGGFAGTGKTQLLRALKHVLTNRLGLSVGMLATTGIAAQNVNGLTIDSHFKIGRDMTVFDRTDYLNHDVIIVDEVSMLNSEMLSLIDTHMRIRAGHSPLPFAGVQIILCGDFLQLPCVMGESILSCPLFIDNFVMCGLKTVVRQNDQEFVDVLRSLRNGVMNHEMINRHQRVPVRNIKQPSLSPSLSSAAAPAKEKQADDDKNIKDDHQSLSPVVPSSAVTAEDSARHQNDNQHHDSPAGNGTQSDIVNTPYGAARTLPSVYTDADVNAYKKGYVEVGQRLLPAYEPVSQTRLYRTLSGEALSEPPQTTIAHSLLANTTPSPATNALVVVPSHANHIAAVPSERTPSSPAATNAETEQQQRYYYPTEAEWLERPWDFVPEDTVFLTPTVQRTKEINDHNLAQLEGAAYTFKSIHGRITLLSPNAWSDTYVLSTGPNFRPALFKAWVEDYFFQRVDGMSKGDCALYRLKGNLFVLRCRIPRLFLDRDEAKEQIAAAFLMLPSALSAHIQATYSSVEWSVPSLVKYAQLRAFQGGSFIAGVGFLKQGSQQQQRAQRESGAEGAEGEEKGGGGRAEAAIPPPCSKREAREKAEELSVIDKDGVFFRSLLLDSELNFDNTPNASALSRPPTFVTPKGDRYLEGVSTPEDHPCYCTFVSTSPSTEASSYCPESVEAELFQTFRRRQEEPVKLKVGAKVILDRNLLHKKGLVNGQVGVVRAIVPLTPELIALAQRLEQNALMNFIEDHLIVTGGQLPFVPIVDFGEIAPYHICFPKTTDILSSEKDWALPVMRVPLQPAYAFTIHKIQGLTLTQNVHVDLQGCFLCYHLLYVAFSRVRKAEQLTVSGFAPWLVLVDSQSALFDRSLPSPDEADQYIPPHIFPALWKRFPDLRNARRVRVAQQQRERSVAKKMSQYLSLKKAALDNRDGHRQHHHSDSGSVLNPYSSLAALPPLSTTHASTSSMGPSVVVGASPRSNPHVSVVMSRGVAEAHAAVQQATAQKAQSSSSHSSSSSSSSFSHRDASFLMGSALKPPSLEDEMLVETAEDAIRQSRLGAQQPDYAEAQAIRAALTAEEEATAKAILSRSSQRSAIHSTMVEKDRQLLEKSRGMMMMTMMMNAATAHPTPSSASTTGKKMSLAAKLRQMKSSSSSGSSAGGDSPSLPKSLEEILGERDVPLFASPTTPSHLSSRMKQPIPSPSSQSSFLTPEEEETLMSPYALLDAEGESLYAAGGRRRSDDESKGSDGGSMGGDGIAKDGEESQGDDGTARSNNGANGDGAHGKEEATDALLKAALLHDHHRKP